MWEHLPQIACALAIPPSLAWVAVAFIKIWS